MRSENDVVITYICDRKACVHCDDTNCAHTSDIRHAANFESHMSGMKTYFEEKEPDISGYNRLTSEAKELISKNPEIVNQLAERYRKVLNNVG